ncbi:hypothetical protein EZV62_014798 [Acer yangbiense]|uniref:Uncharacterized protein n=1 Tax=Acer yangbiense TaxID=1000413 RepID=A0A5C7HTR8_9ROSI|nr:hypothetical protein EZV62_014798 [Acer yangbiense]
MTQNSEVNKKYPDAKQFRTRPLANVEELEALFSGVLATGSYNWSSGTEGIPDMRNTSTPFSSPYAESFVRLLEEDETMQTIQNQHILNTIHQLNQSNKEQTVDKKQKKRKTNEDCEEMSRIISALEKSDDRGPSVKDCTEILIKLLHFEDPHYFVATNALCK